LITGALRASDFELIMKNTKIIYNSSERATFLLRKWKGGLKDESILKEKWLTFHDHKWLNFSRPLTTDERIQDIIIKNSIAAKLLENFRTITGKKIKPSALILRNDAPSSVKDENAITDFRNSLAISSLVSGCAKAINKNNVFEPTCSDHFDFYPVTLNKKENGFIILTPSLWSIWQRVDKFNGQPYPHIPTFKKLENLPDNFIFEKILKQWRMRYVNPNRNTVLSRLLFRSIEVAYLALLSPYRHSSMYEHGTYMSLWISAFEILAQKKQKKEVGYKDVINMLGKYKWDINKLDEKRYKIFERKNRPKGNLVQKLYKELYDARCDFFHGNPVTEKRLYPFKNIDRTLLLHLAPVIYWTALNVYLPPLKRRKHVERIGIYTQEYFNRSQYMDALLSAIGTNIQKLYSKRINKKKI